MGRHSFVIPDGVKPRSGIHALICQWGKWIPDQVRHDNNSTSLRSQWHWIWKGDSSSQAPLEWQDKGNSVLIPTHSTRLRHCVRNDIEYGREIPRRSGSEW